MKLKISPKHVVGRWLSRAGPSLDVQEPASSGAGDTDKGREDEEAPLVSSTNA